jgi:hypothetical protein
VLAPIAWEQLEPEEGRFDVGCIDELFEGARAHGLRLVLLWFGSWKNGASTYVPKADGSIEIVLTKMVIIEGEGTREDQWSVAEDDRPEPLLENAGWRVVRQWPTDAGYHRRPMTASPIGVSHGVG